MASQKIIDKIIKNAEDEVAAIRQDAKDKVAQIKAESTKQTDRKIDDIKIKENADIKEVGRRSDLMTRLESRKIALAEKRKVMDEAFVAAREAMSQLDDGKWSALITKIVLSGVTTGDEKIAVPKKDVQKYTSPFIDGNSMLDHLNEVLTQAGKAGNLTLSNEPAAINDGIVILGDKSDVNGSFDVILNDTRSSCEREVSEILFGKEEV